MEYNRNNNTQQGSSAVAWIGLVLAIIALILAWSAFNRSGQDLEDAVQEQVQESTQEMEERYQELELRVRGNVSEDLRDAAEDVESDEDPNNAGE